MNEDRFTFNGIEYESVKDGFCDKCDLQFEHCADKAVPPCCAKLRKDGQTVNFRKVAQ